MPHFTNNIYERAIYIFAAVVLVYLGYRIGKLVGTMFAAKLIAIKEQELFTAQKGFKTLYETELTNIKSANERLQQQVQTMSAKVEDYRKKAAGLGGLFGSGGKKADAMHALLLANEALEEAR